MQRSVSLAAVTLAAFVFVGACGPAQPVSDGQSTSTAPVTEGPRPGAADPASNFAEWPDDELFTIVPGTSAATGSATLYTASADLGTLTVQGATSAIDGDAIDAEAGRFLTPEYESVLYAHRNATGGIDLRFAGRPELVTTLKNLAPRVAGSADLFDIAAGDLDGMPSQEVDRRDEVVVVHALPPSPDYKLQVSVLDFSSASEAQIGIQTATAATTGVAGQLKAQPFYPENVVAVATGDFDGMSDPRVAAGLGRAKEFAVAYVHAPDQLWIDVFRYSHARDPATNAIVTSLAIVGKGSVTLDGGAALVSLGSLSAVAGDFDMDGRDELAVGTSHYNWTLGRRYVDVRIFRITGAAAPFSVTQVRTIPLRPTGKDALDDTPARVQLAAGHFTFDPNPSLGWVPQRRQIAAAYRDLPGIVHVRTLDLDSTLSAIVSEQLIVAGGGGPFALAAGGFRGALVRPPSPGTESNPTWSLGLVTWEPGATQWTLAVLQPGATTPSTNGYKAAPIRRAVVGPVAAASPTAASRLPLVAADPDGDTLYLGAPAHITLQNLVATDFMLQEPPKHAYWDKEGKFVRNISRKDEFNLSLTSTEGTQLMSSSTDKASYAVGGSATASATASVTAGMDIGIASASASVSTAISASFGYDYSNTESALNSAFASREVTTTYTTDQDDVIVARIQSIDVWRYRVYGLAAASEQKPFFDIVVPGPFETLPAEGGGRGFSWYQPAHENGNVLSYPASSDPGFVHPSDLGPVSKNGVTATGVIYGPELVLFGGASGSKLLKFGSSETDQVELGYSHTISANASVSTTVSAEAEAFGNKVAASGTLGFEAHGNYSWGGSATSSTTTNSSTGLTLTRVAGDDGYAFYPLIYASRDGSLRATYAVDPLLGEGAAFWQRTYGGPDLALNLPRRFFPDMHDGERIWKPRTTPERKEIRGFFVRKSEVNPVKNERDLIPLEVVPDIGLDHFVVLQARVYNYSVGDFGGIPAGAQVCFDKVAVNPANLEEFGERQTIGCAALPAIAPQHYVTAEVPWNTSGATGEATSQKYRIYVRLDPANQVAETYDTQQDGSEAAEYCDALYPTRPCIDPGQNNEGFKYVNVVRRTLSAPGGARRAPHVGVLSELMAGVDRRGQLGTGNVQVYRGQPFAFRVVVTSDMSSQAMNYVLVYDGDPERGGTAIAAQQVHTGDPNPDGTPVWFEWVPQRVGAHRLYAKVLQTLDDPAPGGNVAMLKVEVIPQPASKLR